MGRVRTAAVTAVVLASLAARAAAYASSWSAERYPRGLLDAVDDAPLSGLRGAPGGETARSGPDAAQAAQQRSLPAFRETGGDHANATTVAAAHIAGGDGHGATIADARDHTRLRVFVVGVGGGDCVVIAPPRVGTEQRVMLFDCGSGSGVDEARANLHARAGGERDESMAANAAATRCNGGRDDDRKGAA
jgi:hypothetical protein